jgi:ABC-type Zn uptake system ZnuABC Zn-binding protein ZnuA
MRSANCRPLARAGIALLVLTLLTACGRQGIEANHEQQPVDLKPVELGAGEKLKVVATTNIVGDVVGQVGGDRIELTTLMGVGVDPHSYVPTPADTAAVHDAHVLFANGLDLEEFLYEMLASAGGNAVQVHLSEELDAREAESDDHEDEHGQEGADPHVWFDPKNVIHWAGEIEEMLSILDPVNAKIYAGNAAGYQRILEELDAWIVEQVATIPEAHRKLVTNHPSFGYFAERYGLEQIGTVYPVSPSSEPSAQDIAVLQDAIRKYGVPAVFAESTVNPKLAEQVARDSGVQLVPLYTGSLGEPGSGAESYIELMRYDTRAIVEALK